MTYTHTYTLTHTLSHAKTDTKNTFTHTCTLTHTFEVFPQSGLRIEEGMHFSVHAETHTNIDTRKLRHASIHTHDLAEETTS